MALVFGDESSASYAPLYPARMVAKSQAEEATVPSSILFAAYKVLELTVIRFRFHHFTCAVPAIRPCSQVLNKRNGAQREQVIVKCKGSPVHQAVADEFRRWFDEIIHKIPGGAGNYTAYTETAVELAGLRPGGRKYPDVHLIYLKTTCPLIAVEVSFSETLNYLFEDAERCLRGCEDTIRLVIIVKIDQDGATVPVAADYPWGLSEEAIKGKPSALIDPVIDWYRGRDRPLVGPMKTSVYLYSHDITHRPRDADIHLRFRSQPATPRRKENETFPPRPVPDQRS